MRQRGFKDAAPEWTNEGRAEAEQTHLPQTLGGPTEDSKITTRVSWSCGCLSLIGYTTKAMRSSPTYVHELSRWPAVPRQLRSKGEN